MALKLYYDFFSQPSRALYILLKKANCDFEPKFVDLQKGQQKSEEFTSLSRMQKVPIIDHNGFVLTESVAIMKYLSRENLIPESILPKESKQRARVDEYLEWQHIGLRSYCFLYFKVMCLEPMFSGKATEATREAEYRRRLEEALNYFNTMWLGQGNDFVTGDKPTVADLLAACELEQPRFAGYEPKEKYANIASWWSKVRDFYNPYYDEAHVLVNKEAAKRAKVATKT